MRRRRRRRRPTSGSDLKASKPNFKLDDDDRGREQFTRWARTIFVRRRRRPVDTGLRGPIITRTDAHGCTLASYGSDLLFLIFNKTIIIVSRVINFPYFINRSIKTFSNGFYEFIIVIIFFFCFILLSFREFASFRFSI